MIYHLWVQGDTLKLSTEAMIQKDVFTLIAMFTGITIQRGVLILGEKLFAKKFILNSMREFGLAQMGEHEEVYQYSSGPL